jgi:coenzyme F420-reducing hydrogenase alpha subunit
LSVRMRLAVVAVALVVALGGFQAPAWAQEQDPIGGGPRPKLDDLQREMIKKQREQAEQQAKKLQDQIEKQEEANRAQVDLLNTRLQLLREISSKIDR